jgi:hypothetical protein
MSESIRNQGARTNPLMSRLNPRHMKGSRAELADLVRAALLDVGEIVDDEEAEEETAVEDFEAHIDSRRGLAQAMRAGLEASTAGLNQLGGTLRSAFPGATIDGRNA